MDPRPISVRRHDDGVDRWEMVDAAPSPELRGRIGRYSDYWEEIASFAARRELATTEVVLIYALAAPLEITGADGRVVTVRAGEAFVGGISDATSLSRGLGPQAGIHVFMPLASMATVTGAPVAEIANCVAPLRDLIGRGADDFGNALCDAVNAEARFDLLDAFFARRFADAQETDRSVPWAMPHLASAVGPLTSKLAAEIGWSRKHFIQRFRDATGVSPDRYRRIARFERFAAAIAARPDDGLAGLAADCGFVDQAHLARDVRAFADMTPGELRTRLIPGGGGVRHD
ncbi:helix-turn-helix domain-containing protein [Sphingosinicella sp. LHD-64]|uniref:AraC family transcriptional regulator n=1 Tax=Sphingosinicella sp. LHD-64 TaxID=3072139 RepID=UPI00280CF1FC|nr:helix-turn-helix domain-containing protein [Sphingosinicella sp. LHD-64]MDQ8755865.1 helix-turn-helix domain-containing protein [Sphingosinicella sp. LHD-64]